MNLDQTGKQTIIQPRTAGVLSLASFAIVVLGLFLFSQIGDIIRANQQGRIHITAANLQAARTKWQSQNIKEYEMVLDVEPSGSGGSMCLGCGTYTLHINDNQATIISYMTATVSAFYHYPDYNYPMNKGATIGSLFDQVDSILTSGPFRCTGSPEPILFDHTVEFDPELGYPSMIDTNAREGGTTECGGSSIEAVKSLKVIR
jgi:Family of unknown function (DUF6174)